MTKEELLADKVQLEMQLQQIAGALGYLNKKLSDMTTPIKKEKTNG